MTPEQAVNVLDQMAARAAGTRGDHEAAIQAIQVLTLLIQPPAPDAVPVE